MDASRCRSRPARLCRQEQPSRRHTLPARPQLVERHPRGAYGGHEVRCVPSIDPIDRIEHRRLRNGGDSPGILWRCVGGRQRAHHDLDPVSHLISGRDRRDQDADCQSDDRQGSPEVANHTAPPEGIKRRRAENRTKQPPFPATRAGAPRSRSAGFQGQTHWGGGVISSCGVPPGSGRPDPSSRLMARTVMS